MKYSYSMLTGSLASVLRVTQSLLRVRLASYLQLLAEGNWVFLVLSSLLVCPYSFMLVHVWAVQRVSRVYTLSLFIWDTILVPQRCWFNPQRKWEAFNCAITFPFAFKSALKQVILSYMTHILQEHVQFTWLFKFRVTDGENICMGRFFQMCKYVKVFVMTDGGDTQKYVQMLHEPELVCRGARYNSAGL